MYLRLSYLLILSFWLSSAQAGAGDIKSGDTEHNKVLSQGYSQLYEAVSGLRWLDELLLLKFESDSTEKFIGDLATYSSELRDGLQKLAKDYPSISLEDNGLPLIEKNTRKAVQKDRIKSLAPITGASGVEFERTLLLTQSGVLNQLQHMTQVMAQIENNEDRRKVLTQAQRRFSKLYGDVVSLLNKKYFK